MSSKKGQQKFGSDPKSTMSSNGSRTSGPTTSSAPPPANAWSQPLRPKPNVAAPPGMGGRGGRGSQNNSATGSNSSSSNSASNGVQNALRERFIGLSLNMVGQKVVITQTNGAVFEGIFHTFSPFASLPAATKNKYVIKACKVIKPPPSDESGDNEAQVVDQSTVIISADKVACLTAKSMRMDSLSATNSNGVGQPKSLDAFRTDTEISGSKSGRARELVMADSVWTSGGTVPGNPRAAALLGAGLEENDKGGSRRKPFNMSNANSGSRGKLSEWDQFRANQELFNVNATFDENLYTTELDKTRIDNQKIAEAERLAREIENTPSANMHVAEERGQKVEGDYDEEDRYSGVLKESKPVIGDSTTKAKPAEIEKSTQAPLKKMNYAAAAAKADTSKKTKPPGFPSNKQRTESEKPQQPEKEAAKPTAVEQKPAKDGEAAPSDKKPEETTAESEKESQASKPENKTTAEGTEPVESKPEPSVKEEKAASANKITTEKPKETTEKTSDKPATAKVASKLNANAKEFTLNPTAKTFTPGVTSNPVPAVPEGPYVDPNAMHLQQVAAHMPGPHYMHGGPMGHAGMMPMMAPQFRYPAGYGMDQQHMSQMPPHQPQHVGSALGSGAPSPGPGSGDEEGAQAQQDPDAAPQASLAPQQQQPPQPGGQVQPQQQVPVPYGVPPPGAYYPGGMAMHPRGPGGPHPGYHPQFVGGPQQMPVGPGGAPYRPMYPMQPGGMAPNVQVRGPGGPYFPVAPVPYPPGAYGGHGMMEDESGFRGGRGGGRGGRGGGRRGGRHGGRGRGAGRGYNNYHHGGRHSGPGQSQNGPAGSENWSAPENGNPQQDIETAGPPPPEQSEEKSTPNQ